jgi:methionyl-tRNA formyltransferase
VYVDTDGLGLPKSLSTGDIHVDRRSVRIGTASQPVRLGQVQAPGKKFMNAVDWARGARLDSSVRVS